MERREQAEFLQSIGCQNIQGYLYSTPVDEATFVNELKGNQMGEMSPVMNLVEHLDPGAFWSDVLQRCAGCFSVRVAGVCTHGDVSA